MIYSIIVLAFCIIILQGKFFHYILKSPRIKLNKTIYFFIFGILSALNVFFLGNLFFTDVYTIDYGILTKIVDVYWNVAFIEEFCKLFSFLVIYFISYKKNYSYLNIIFYMVLVSLGFAFIENIGYSHNFESPVTLLFIRSLTATVGHVCSGLLIGHGLSVLINNKTPKKWLNFLWFFSLAVLTHGTYDYVLMYYDSVLSIVFVMIMTIYTYEYVLKKIDNQIIPK